MDIGKLEYMIKTKGAKTIPFCMITVTNNAGGGQPVSMENMRSVKKTLEKYNIPLVIDAAAMRKIPISSRKTSRASANEASCKLRRRCSRSPTARR